MAGIKVPGIFTPGTVKGIVTESKYISGTYIVVNTEEERINLSPNVAITGTRVYVIESEIEYICTKTEGWKEEPTNETISQAVKDLTTALGEVDTKIDNLSNKVDTIETNINSLSINKQDTLISGANIKTINGESILGSGNISISGGSGDAHVVQVATKSELPNIGKDKNTVYFVRDEQATYMFDEESLTYVCVGTNYHNIKCINGGTAEVEQ